MNGLRDTSGIRKNIEYVITAVLAVILALDFVLVRQEEKAETEKLKAVALEYREKLQQQDDLEKEAEARKLLEQNDSFYQKLSDGFDVSVLIVGGSPGTGRGASDHEHAWPVLLEKEMETAWDTDVTITNLSLNDNTAYGGYVSVKRDEGSYDAAVILYGADDNVNNFGIYYESVIRAVLEKNPSCSIIPVLDNTSMAYTDNVRTIQQIAEYYGITTADTLAEAEQSPLSWEELLNNGYPSDENQILYKNALMSVITEETDKYAGKPVYPEEYMHAETSFFENLKYIPASSFERDGNTYTYAVTEEIQGRVAGMDLDYVTGNNYWELGTDGSQNNLGVMAFWNNIGYEDDPDAEKSHYRIINNWITDWGTVTDELFEAREEIRIGFLNDENGTLLADGFRGLIVSSEE